MAWVDCTASRETNLTMARLAFLGTPDVAVLTLEGLHNAGHEIALVVSQPDVRRSRGGTLQPSPVKAAALSLGLEVTDDLDKLNDVALDGVIVVAYGKIIPDDLLNKFLMINIHFSLLPRWRGAAPLERALLAGDPTTGVCVMKIVSELDAGPVYARADLEIGEKSLEELRSELGVIGTALVVDLLEDGLESLPEPTTQTGEVVYAAKMKKDEFLLDFTQPAAQVLRVIRLGSSFTFIENRRLRILSATLVPEYSGSPGELVGEVVGTGQGGLRLERVQGEGGREMDASAWRRGVRDQGILRLGATQGP